MRQARIAYSVVLFLAMQAFFTGFTGFDAEAEPPAMPGETPVGGLMRPVGADFRYSLPHSEALTKPAAAG
ncbi:MAG: hypothetical protein NVS3B11_06100 [Collimonas sp.]